MSYDVTCTYYTFYTFGKLYALKNQVESTIQEANDLYVIAAADGEKKGVMITNNAPEAVDVETNLCGDFKCFLVNQDNHFTATEEDTRKFTLAPYTVMFIENK